MPIPIFLDKFAQKIGKKFFYQGYRLIEKVYKPDGLDLGYEFPLEDGIALLSLANLKIKKGSKVLEIGSWKGRSSVILGLICKKKNASLTCVDTWRGSYGVEHHQKETSIMDVYTVFLANIKKFGLENVVKSFRLDTRDFFKICDEKYDFIFIDGDHRYTPFKKDLTNSIDILKQNGTLCGHDCEYLFQTLPDKVKHLIKQNLEEDFIRLNEDMNGLHPGVIFGLESILGDKVMTIRSEKMAGNGIWFRLESKAEKEVILKAFSKNLMLFKKFF